MLILAMVHLFMIGILLMLMLTQAHPWIKAKIPGRVIKVMPLSFLQRINFHRSSLIALALGILVGRAGGWLPTSLAIFAGAMAVAVLFLPMKYTFTTQGVAVGQAIFRPWKEFTGISKRTHGIVLEHPSFLGRLTLFVRPVELDSVLVHIEKTYQ